MYTHETIHRVQYYETDAMGIVHHSNYIRWFETGRTEFLRSVGMPYSELERDKIIVPVLSVECEYKYPAKYDDLITIKTSFAEMKGIRFSYIYEVYYEDRLIVKGKSTHVFTNENLRPINIRKVYPDIYHKISELIDSDKII